MNEILDVLVKLINTVGFPIAITIYVLMILQKTMDKVLIHLETLMEDQRKLSNLLQELVYKITERKQ